MVFEVSVFALKPNGAPKVPAAVVVSAVGVGREVVRKEFEAKYPRTFVVTKEASA